MSSSLTVILVHPSIPQNTGNIIRMCANTGTDLGLVEPCAFGWEDARLRRAHLDYEEYADVQRFPSWQACVDHYPGRRFFAVETGGPNTVYETAFQPGDILVLGSEVTGLPEDVLASIPVENYVSLPMVPGNRSMNLGNATAVAVFEAWRQLGFPGGSSRGQAMPFAFTNGMPLPNVDSNGNPIGEG